MNVLLKFYHFLHTLLYTQVYYFFLLRDSRTNKQYNIIGPVPIHTTTYISTVRMFVCIKYTYNIIFSYYFLYFVVFRIKTNI